MQRKSIIGACAGLGLCMMTALPAHAVNLQLTLTVDNYYGLYTGSGTAATNFVGADLTWQTSESYNLNVPANNYLYVVASSDVSGAQGFLSQLDDLDNGFTFFSQDWQVMATGQDADAPFGGTAPDLALLTQEILDANGGGNASGGWVDAVVGPANGHPTWGPIAGISSNANWVWHSADGDPDPTMPGANHDEWLVFRIQIGPTAVPEPGALGLLGAAIGACGFALRRKNAKV